MASKLKRGRGRPMKCRKPKTAFTKALWGWIRNNSLSVGGASDYLGVAYRTVQRWLSGEDPSTSLRKEVLAAISNYPNGGPQRLRQIASSPDFKVAVCTLRRERCTSRVNLRLSPSDKKQLEGYAALIGCTLSEYLIRSALLVGSHLNS